MAVVCRLKINLDTKKVELPSFDGQGEVSTRGIAINLKLFLNANKNGYNLLYHSKF